ncbi:kcna2 [Symbiodinium microadriaticum]|nr:kcna2 [Symbiodinium sp. KB8]CAE7322408.1 kcna2 [Symbiodinium microadriaticum]
MAWVAAAAPCRPSQGQAWSQDSVWPVQLPGSVAPDQVAHQLFETFQEYQASQTEHISKWIAEQETRAAEEQILLEQLVRESLNLPPAADTGARGDQGNRAHSEVEDVSSEDLELLVVGQGTTNTMSTAAVADSGEVLTSLPASLKTSLRRHAAAQQNSLEEWARRHERLQKQAYIRMQALLRRSDAQGVRPYVTGTRSSRSPSFAGVGMGGTSSLLSHSAHHSPDLPRKDVGETGGTPDVQPLPSKRVSWLPSTNEMHWCRCIFLVLDDPDNFLMGKVISAFVVATILLSTTSFILESMQSFAKRPDLCEELRAAGEPLTVEACEPVPHESFFYIEAACILIFTVEYLARLLTCHAEPALGETPTLRVLHYARMPLNIVDLLAVAPFYLGFIIGNSVSSLRVLRLARVLRLFKLAKHHGGMRLCLEAMMRSGFPLAILMFFNVIVGIIFACVMFFVEGQRFSVAPQFTQPRTDMFNNTVPAPFPTGVFVRIDAQGEHEVQTPFRSIPIALWWAFSTMTTVGYGDIVPTTLPGKIVGVMCFYCGVILLALPIGVLSSNFENAYSQASSHSQGRRLSFHEHLRNSTTRSTKLESHVQQMQPARGSRWFPEEEVSWSRQLFLIMSDPGSSRASNVVSWFVTAVIMVATVSMLLESLPEFNVTPAECKPWPEITIASCRPVPRPAFEYVELVCMIVFTIDYVLRLALVHRALPQDIGLVEKEVGRLKMTWKYAIQVLNLVDFFAIAPYYISLSGLYQGSTAALRVLRLVRVFRLLKSPKLRDGVEMIINIVGDSLPGILSVFSLTSIVCILFSSSLWIAEGTEYSVSAFPNEYPLGVYIRPTKYGYGVEPTPFTSISHCFWWFFVTATTVGYGDEYPTTTLGRLTAIGSFYAGIVLVAIKLTIVGRALKRQFPQWNGQAA